MEMGLLAIVKFALALIFVLALMGGLALGLKKFGFMQTAMTARKDRRLKLIETLPLDTRRKAAIIECDGVQHLLILGPNGDTLVQNNLTPRTLAHDRPFKTVA